MGRRRKRRDLFVAMNGELVGTLTRDAGSRLSFAYAAEWLGSGLRIPLSLSLPLSSEPYSDAAVSSYFDNLLPDDEGIRQRMQVVLDAESTDPFDLLSVAGADCVGAVQLFPARDMPTVRTLQSSPIDDASIARILRGYTARPLGMTPEEDDFRISIAGAQEKTAFLWRDERWHRPEGTTPTTHLFKLPIGVVGRGSPIDLSDSVENEWLCLRIARAFGLPVPNAEIARFEDVKVLIVERFDRQWSRDGSWIVRQPQEDACQALGVPPSRKYEADGGPGIEAIMDLLLRSQDPAADRRTFFSACVLIWLLAAPDGHAKNYSFSLYPEGRARLTPLYDVMSAYPLVARKQLALPKLRLAMAALGENRHYRWQEIERRHFIATAKRTRFSERDAVAVLASMTDRIDAVADEVATNLPTDFPSAVAEPILEGLRKMRPSAS